MKLFVKSVKIVGNLYIFNKVIYVVDMFILIYHIHSQKT
jgi:hypothetical protein